MDKRDCREKRYLYKHGRGVSSIFLHNRDQLIDNLNIKTGDKFLDLGCGAGDYSMALSEVVGETGKIYAVDINQHSLDALDEELKINKISNIETKIGDIMKKIPMSDSLVDHCLVSTVMHIYDLEIYGEKLFKEIKRVIKNNGILSIIECKKMNNHNKHRTIDKEKIKEVASYYGFKMLNYFEYEKTFLLQLINIKKE